MVVGKWFGGILLVGGGPGGWFPICVVALFKPKHTCTPMHKPEERLSLQTGWPIPQLATEVKDSCVEACGKANLRPQKVLVLCCERSAATGDENSSMYLILQDTTGILQGGPGSQRNQAQPQVLMCKWLNEESLLWPVIPEAFVLPNAVFLFENQILFWNNPDVVESFPTCAIPH